MACNMFYRGEIYLANLYPKKGDEVGKTRPVLILQSDILNSIGHTTSIVAPISSVIIENAHPLRFFISKRDKLQRDSQVLCDQIRAIDVGRLIPDKIATLSEAEMLQIQKNIEIILDFE